MNNSYGNLSADGDTHDAPSDFYKVYGNEGVWIHVSGDFGGGTFTMKFISMDGSTERTIAGTAKTDVADFKLDLPHGTKIFGTLSGATAPDLDWEFLSVTHRN